MSQGNVDVIWKQNAAVRRGDLDALAATIDPHILIRTDARWPEQRILRSRGCPPWYSELWESGGTDDMSPMGLGIYEGLAAIRAFFEDWLSTFEEFALEAEEILDFRNGVGFAVVRMVGHPIGSEGEVRLRYASVGVWTDGLIVRITNYSDIDEARAAAERFAEERG